MRISIVELGSTYSVAALEEDIATDVEGVCATGLATTEDHTIACIGKSKSFLLDVDHVGANSKGDVWKLIGSRFGGKDVALLGAIVL